MLAEKYRPKSLDEVVGQEHIIPHLKEIVNRKAKVHMLFIGPPGCIDGEEKILTWNAEKGEVVSKTISEIYEEFKREIVPYVLTLSGNKLTVMPGLPIEAGIKKIYRVRTDVGDVMLSEEHLLFLSKHKLIRTKDLKVGDKIIYIDSSTVSRCSFDGGSMPNLWGIFQATVITHDTDSSYIKNRVQKNVPNYTISLRGIEDEMFRKNKEILEHEYRRSKEEKRETQANDEEAKENSYNGKMSSMWEIIRDIYQKWEAKENVLLAVMLSEGEFTKSERISNKITKQSRMAYEDFVRSKEIHPKQSILSNTNVNFSKESLGKTETRPNTLSTVHNETEGSTYRKKKINMFKGRHSFIKKYEKKFPLTSRAENEYDSKKPVNFKIPLECTSQNTNRYKISRLYNNLPQEVDNRSRWAISYRDSRRGQNKRQNISSNGILCTEVCNGGSYERAFKSKGANRKSTKRIWSRVQVLGIEEVGFRKAYDLIVPRYHNFITENGIVLHNCGKTSTAYALSHELNVPIVELNASDERGINIVRGKIKTYAFTMGERIILLDEADSMTEEAQHALRRTMEKTQQMFILTANDEWKIIEPIKSRCVIFRFRKLKNDEVLKIILKILMAEKISVKITPEIKEALLTLIEYVDGDVRHALNMLDSLITANKEIIVENIKTLIPPDLATQVLKTVLEGRWEEGLKKLEDLYIQNKLDSKLTVEQLYKAIGGLNINPIIKLKMYEKLGDIERNLKLGCNPLIQFSSFLATTYMTSVLAGAK